jgi:tetratricopeptide (TPR) repeat protein
MSDLAKAQSLFFSALQAQERSDLNSAEQLYREALRLVPGRSSIVKNLAAILLESAKFDEASELCAGHLQSHPEDYAVWTQLGNTQLGIRQFERALENYNTALSLAPDDSETLINAAYALESLGRLRDALVHLNRVITLAPENAAALGNRGNILAKLNRFQDALGDFERSRDIAPASPMSYWNESVCRLFTGDFEGGWKLYDWGWKAGQRGKRPAGIMQPQWNGIDYVKRLLVWGEQGIGDQILFSSMLEELRDRAKQIIVAVDFRLLPLLRRTFPELEFADIKDANNLHDADQQIAMGDLGGFFRKGWHDFPKERKRALIADTERSQMLRTRMGNGRELICGFSWSSTNPKIGPFKSLDEADLSALGAIKGVRWVDLQYGDTRRDLHRFQSRFGLNISRVDDIDNFNDIDGLAALIGTCDIVVSISNTSAHLAGALGVSTIVMLPEAVGRLWYWHHGASSSPWYPSCSLIRQSTPGDWTPVIEGVCSQITERVKARKNLTNPE